MRIWSGISMVLAVAALAACGREDRSGGESGTTSRPGGGSAAGEARSAGAELYAFGCAPCHGARGEGTQIGSPLNDRRRDVQQVMQAVQQGVATTEPPHVPMPPRGDGSWSDQQVRTVSEYVATLAR
ncbi:MAG TPA: cytochrome c [Longimicrobium sp.]|nr:cytochrome c [Longimicrobium sp.]